MRRILKQSGGLFSDERESLYYTWSKEFLEAGKQRLAGDTARQASSPEVKELRSETVALKEVVADLTLENRLLKKSMIGGEPWSAIGPRSCRWSRHWSERPSATASEYEV